MQGVVFLGGWTWIKTVLINFGDGWTEEFSLL